VVKLTNNGAYASSLTDNALQGTLNVAVDASNRVYATGTTTGSAVSGALSEFAGGSAAAVSPVTALGSPFGIATDSNAVWLADMATGALLRTSYGAASGQLRMTGSATIAAPTSVAVDAAGSIWMTNTGGNTVLKFIGLATPVATPLAANVGP